MTSLFPTINEDEPTAPTGSLTRTGPSPFPAYVVSRYTARHWVWHLLIDRETKSQQWEVHLSIWSPRYSILNPWIPGRKPGYRFRRIPCADRPSAEQLAMNLERMIQRHRARPSTPGPTPNERIAARYRAQEQAMDDARSLTEDF